MNRRSGLTLLELLISLAILAMIMAAIAGAMGLGLRMLDRSAGLSATADDIALRVRLRGLIEQALPPAQIAPFEVAFKGTPTGFAFTTLSAKGMAPQAAALRVRVTVGAVIGYEVNLLDDAGTETPFVTATLATGAQNVDVEYYDASLSPGQWLPDWPDDARLPALIRITGEDATPDWPEFTVAPLLGAATE